MEGAGDGEAEQHELKSGLIYKEGPLMKENQTKKGWSGRWFVLDGVLLAYYSSKRDSRLLDGTLKPAVPKRALQISPKTTVEVDEKKLRMTVSSGESTMNLHCPRKRDFLSWSAAIQQNAQVLSTAHSRLGHGIAKCFHACGPGLFGAIAGEVARITVLLTEEGEIIDRLPWAIDEHDIDYQDGDPPIRNEKHSFIKTRLLKASLRNELLHYTFDAFANADGTFTIEYQLSRADDYELQITYDGKPICDSPFRIR
jgi:hypothetical protein